MKKVDILKNRKTKSYVSSYGDKVFNSLAELLRYEAEIEAKMDSEEKKDRNIPYKE